MPKSRTAVKSTRSVARMPLKVDFEVGGFEGDIVDRIVALIKKVETELGTTRWIRLRLTSESP